MPIVVVPTAKVPPIVAPAIKEPSTMVPAPPSLTFIADPVMYYYHLHLCLITSNMGKSISIVPDAGPMAMTAAMATFATEVPPAIKVSVSNPTLHSLVGL